MRCPMAENGGEAGAGVAMHVRQIHGSSLKHRLGEISKGGSVVVWKRSELAIYANGDANVDSRSTWKLETAAKGG